MEWGIWTVPIERMNAGCGHSVPLHRQAKETLGGMCEIRIIGLVWPSLNRDGPLSTKALEMAMRRRKVEAKGS